MTAPSFVQDTFADLILDAATLLTAQRELLTLESDAAAHFDASARRIARHHRLYARQDITAGTRNWFSELAAMSTTMARSIRVLDSDESTFRSFLNVATYTPPSSIIALDPARQGARPMSSGRRAELSLSSKFVMVVRAMGLVEASAAVLAVNFTRQARARQARADLVEAMQTAAELGSTLASGKNVGLDSAFGPLWDTALGLVGAAADALTKSDAISTPVLEIKTDTTMNAIYWAHRLYGHPARYAEITQLNGVPFALTMPRNFDALSNR